MKQKLKNYFKLGILLYLISLFVVSCSNEITEIQLTETQKIQKEFSFENFNDNSVKNNLVIDWDDFTLKQDMDTISNNKVYEFNISSKINTSIDNGKQKLAVKYKLLVSKNDSEQWNFELIKFLSNNSKSIDDISYFNPSSFSGTLYHYNLNGVNIKIKAYKKGKLLSEFPDKEKDVIYAQSKVPSIGGDTDGFWMFTRTRHYTDWYKGNATIGWTYTHSVYNYSTSEYVWVSTGSNSNSDYHAHGGEHAADNHLKEITIDTSFSNSDKANCTYKKLLEKTTLNELLKDFFGTNDSYDLTFTITPNLTCNHNDNAGGCTTNNLKSDGSVTIALDQDYINDTKTPTLFIARTIIHEAIHANLYLAVYNHENGNTANIPDIDDFPAIYEKYRGINGLQHQVMADLYIGLIAKALKDVHPLLNDTSFYNDISTQYPDLSMEDFYKSIAYVGLRDTASFNDFYSNPVNAENFSVSYETAKANSTPIPNCE